MAIDISGSVYADQGVNKVRNGRHVNVSVNGQAVAGSTTTAADGSYTLSAITAASAAVLTIYLEGDAESAVTLTRSTGVNMTGIDLYNGYLNLRSDDGSPLTGSNVNTGDASLAPGIVAIYSASSNSVAVLASGVSLLIMSGQTFAPNGGGTVTVPGSWVNLGTFTAGSSTIFLTGSGAQTLTSGGSSFNNLTFNTGGGTYTLQDNLVITSTISLTNMTLDVGANFSITITTNNFTSGTNGTFVSRLGTVTFSAATGTQTLQCPQGGFYNLTHSGAGTLQLSTNTLVVTNNLVNSAGILDSNSQDVIVGGNWNNSATFTQGTRTVTFNGSVQTIVGSTTFYNFVACTNNDIITFTDGTTQTITNSVKLQNVTLKGSGTAGWTIAMPATQTIDHVTVSRSTATINTAVAGNTSSNAGNNVNWTFVALPIHTDGKSF